VTAATATELKTSWSYNELPEGIYSASVDQYGDKWMFRAYPNRGDHCDEGIYHNKEQACDIGARYASGELRLPGLYSACF
jgi:hypothetical protein